jgi:hypothetical protein
MLESSSIANGLMDYLGVEHNDERNKRKPQIDLDTGDRT